MKELFCCWCPFAFTALLCAVVITGILSGMPDVGMPAFYCFLPMSFYYLGGTLYESSKRMRELEARIKLLENNR